MNAKPNYRRTKHSCYFTYLAMSTVFSLPPLLFGTFHEMYAISYTLLGTLVLTNFITQLSVDLVFSFFSKYFNMRLVARCMPLLTTLGLLVYALFPAFLPQYAYAGLLLGTILFSLAAGLNEVLLSPLVASLPSDTPEKDMSMLHSLYAWGVLMVVVVSTAFFRLFGTEKWMYLTVFWAVLPIISFVLFSVSPMPEMKIDHSQGKGNGRKRNIGLLLCVLCIFFGSAAENGMTNWISVFIESALNVPKAMGDLMGLAVFAVLLGIVRTLYAKYGGNIEKVLLASMAGAIFCYLVASLSPLPVLSMIACIVTGIFTSMLWPGTLIYMEEKFHSPGVVAYALMAAGGDFGASVAPQLLGAVVDKVSAAKWAMEICEKTALSPEQLGMKTGMLIAAIFPIIGVTVLLYMRRFFGSERL